jgi:hypothetical protein
MSAYPPAALLSLPHSSSRAATRLPSSQADRSAAWRMSSVLLHQQAREAMSRLLVQQQL